MNRSLFLLFIFTAFSICGQTLTQSFNEPVISDVDNSVLLDTSAYKTGMPKNTGSGVIWDFTKLKAVGPVFVTTYDAPNSTSLSAGYPGATLVQKDGSNVFLFLKSVTTPTTQTEVLGFASNSMSCTFTNSAIAAIYPVTFGATQTDNIAGTFTFGTINGNCSGTIKTTADGTGTLNLPDGFTYKNVIRVKSVQTITGSQGLFSATVKQTVINFYDMSKKFPVLSLNYNSAALAFTTPTVSGSATGDVFSFNAIPENPGYINTAEFFPNPASGHLFIDLPGSGTSYIDILDCRGVEVKHLELQNSGKQEAVDISDVSPGIYFIRTSGTPLATKLLIQ